MPPFKNHFPVSELSLRQPFPDAFSKPSMFDLRLPDDETDQPFAAVGSATASFGDENENGP